MLTLSEWRGREDEALTPPPLMTPSDWCGKYLRVPAGNKHQSRPYDPDITPYVREILDCIVEYGVDVIAFVASTQVGKTMLELAAAAYLSAERPGDILLTMADQAAAEYMLEDRLKPLFRLSPKLRKLMSSRKTDDRKDKLQLLGNAIYPAHATSPTSLASKPVPYLLCDEVAKWPLYSKDEANPLKLAKHRARWFPHSVAMVISTPKYTWDLMWQEWLAGDQRKFFVPCPHCGEYQVLEFAQVRLRPGHEEERNRSKIINERLAVYYCESCEEPIEDAEKIPAERKGLWVPKGARIEDGQVVGVQPSRFRSYWINALYSPMLTWSEILAEFFDSKGEPAKLQDFVNSWLGMPWEEKESGANEDQLGKVVGEHELGTVPDEVRLLVAGADVQEHQVYWVVRGFGPEDRSYLIDCGVLDGDPQEPDLEKLGSMMANREWGGRKVSVCFCDSGYRTHEVYDLARRYAQVIRPIKGHDTMETPHRTSLIEKADGRRRFPGAVSVTHINTDYYKTRIVAKIVNAPAPGSRGRWEVAVDVPKPYERSLCSEQKVIERDSKGRGKVRWVTKPGYRSNHHWDCEVYAYAAADFKVASRIQPEEPAKSPAAESRPARPAREIASAPAWNRYDGEGW